MKSLPPKVESYKKTPVYTQASVDPDLFIEQHRSKKGTWCLIVVLEGQLHYRILEPEVEEIILSPTRPGVVEPTILHEIKPLGDASFYLEFFR